MGEQQDINDEICQSCKYYENCDEDSPEDCSHPETSIEYYGY